MEKEKLSVFEKASETIGWIRIFLSPLIIGLIISAVIYFSNPSDLTLVIAIALTILSIIVGVIWATKIQKKHGAMNFVSKVNASPDLDNGNKRK